MDKLVLGVLIGLYAIYIGLILWQIIRTVADKKDKREENTDR